MIDPNGIIGPGGGGLPAGTDAAGISGPRAGGMSGADGARAFMDALRADAAGAIEPSPQAPPPSTDVSPVGETTPPLATGDVAAVDPPTRCAEVELAVERLLEPGVVRDGINGRMQGVRDDWNRLEHARRELSEAVRDGRIDPMSPEHARIREDIGMATIRLQVRAQEAHFGVELLSKLAENATGGVRTILQTQA